MVESPNPSSTDEAANRSPYSRWWERIGKAVVGVGALAGVVTGVVAAVNAIHPPDPEDFAQFTDVTISAGIPFSEYRQRLVPPSPVPKSLGEGSAAGARILVVATADPVRASTNDPVAPVTKMPSSKTPTTTSSRTKKPGTATSTTRVKPSTSRVSRRPPLIEQREFAAEPGTMRVFSGGAAGPAPNGGSGGGVPECGASRKACQVLAQSKPIDSKGNPLTEKQALEVYKNIVKGSRTVTVRKDGKKSKEMIGAVINVNVELSGLRGQRVLLSWSFWRANGGAQVYGNWLNENFAYEIVPGSNHDNAAVNFWIPMPKKKGPYIVRSTLTRNGQAMITKDSLPIA